MLPALLPLTEEFKRPSYLQGWRQQKLSGNWQFTWINCYLPVRTALAPLKTKRGCLAQEQKDFREPPDCINIRV